jgi:hypothetical protein
LGANTSKGALGAAGGAATVFVLSVGRSRAGIKTEEEGETEASLYCFGCSATDPDGIRI